MSLLGGQLTAGDLDKTTCIKIHPTQQPIIYLKWLVQD